MAFQHFRELGWWNIYFATKLALYFQGLGEFHVLGNLGLALLLLLRINQRASKVVRQLLAVGIALWLLRIDGLLAPQLLHAEFLLLPGSDTWNLSLTLGLCVAAYMFFSRYIEVSVISIAGILVAAWLNLGWLPSMSGDIDNTPTNKSGTSRVTDTGPDTSNRGLNRKLDAFFAEELRRLVPFPAPEREDTSTAAASDFDIVVLSICSLAWDDLQLAGAAEHPLLADFDIVFDHFNAATSYSGPAVIRLLNANCGQRPHDRLFDDSRPPRCLLPRQLENIGFRSRLLMNHDGVFDNFLSQLGRYGGLPTVPPDFRGIPVAQKSFDGTPIFDDLAILRRWQQQRATQDQNSAPGEFVFYNSVSLHDGNRIVGSNAVGIDSYRQRLNRLLSQLQQFVQTLENSDRPTLLLLVPEHGAGLRGDLMQLPGMREIPAQSITHIPVAAKLIGANRSGPQVRVGVKTSYLALSALIVNVIQQQPFLADSYTPASLANNLPMTPRVSQNEGSTVMAVEGLDYVSLDGESWTAYPRRK